MPQRFLRPGIRNSERWNSVPWECQSFYIRILTLVDDYGRYDGRASVLWGECFSVWNELHPEESVNLLRVKEMLQRLAADSVQLVDLYTVDDKQILQVTQWQERIREGAKEKWPKNPKAQQVAAKRSETLPPPPTPTPSPAIIDHTPTPSDRECELPPGFPKTVDDAIARAAPLALDPVFIIKVYNLAVSRGGGKTARKSRSRIGQITFSSVGRASSKE